MNKRLYFKTIALITVIIMVINSMPVKAAAEEFNNAVQEQTIEYDSSNGNWGEKDGVYYYKEYSADGVCPKNSDWTTDTFKYYRSQLTDNEKRIYDMLYNVDEETQSITVDVSIVDSKKSINRACTAFIYDNPVARNRWSSYYPDVVLENNQYVVSMESWECWSGYLQEYVIQSVDIISDNIDASADRYTRVRYIFDYLENNSEYDPCYPLYTTVTHNMDQTMSGVLYGKVGVCAGYADTFKALCDALGVPCIQVGNAAHAWNFVQMENGKWYSIDASISIGSFYDNGTDLSEFLLMGYKSTEYINNANYVTDLYLGNKQDELFVFPELQAELYGCSSDWTEVDYEFECNPECVPMEAVYEVTDNGDGTCSLDKYKGICTGDLIVPEIINGLKVTSISDYAYAYCRGFDGKIVLPDTLINIGEGAFAYCSELTGTLTLPTNLKNIEDNGFMECNNLKKVVVNDNLDYVGKYGFAHCDSLSGDIVTV